MLLKKLNLAQQKHMCTSEPQNTIQCNIAQ